MNSEDGSTYHAPITHLNEVRKKYASALAFLHETLRTELSNTMPYPSRIARYAEHYNFCFRVGIKLDEWLMREQTEGKHGFEVEIDAGEVEFFKQVVLLDVYNEAAASFEDNISLMRH